LSRWFRMVEFGICGYLSWDIRSQLFINFYLFFSFLHQNLCFFEASAIS
jgi:hypothetical protein